MSCNTVMKAFLIEIHSIMIEMYQTTIEITKNNNSPKIVFIELYTILRPVKYINIKLSFIEHVMA